MLGTADRAAHAMRAMVDVFEQIHGHPRQGAVLKCVGQAAVRPAPPWRCGRCCRAVAWRRQWHVALRAAAALRVAAKAPVSRTMATILFSRSTLPGFNGFAHGTALFWVAPAAWPKSAARWLCPRAGHRPGFCPSRRCCRHSPAHRRSLGTLCPALGRNRRKRPRSLEGLPAKIGPRRALASNSLAVLERITRK